jgi:hypothetical protein
MESPPRIDPTGLAFDFDGVFADTMKLFLDIAREEFQIDWLRYEDIVCYQLVECLDIDPAISDRIIDHILDGTYTIPLQPIDGAAGVLSRLAAHNGGLLFVTARPHPGPVAQWIAEVLSIGQDRLEVIATGTSKAKSPILRERGISHFVEDRLDTCFLLQDAGITPVLFRQPWNREPHGFIEVGSWSELASMIDFPKAGQPCLPHP